MWIDFYLVKCTNCGTIQTYNEVSSWGSYTCGFPQENVCWKCGKKLNSKNVISDEEEKDYCEAPKDDELKTKLDLLEKCRNGEITNDWYKNLIN